MAEAMTTIAEATRLQSAELRLAQIPTWAAQSEGNLEQQPVYFIIPSAPPASPPSIALLAY